MRTGLPRLLFAAALPYRNHLPSFQRVRPFSLSATSPPSGFAALGLNPLLLPALTSLGIEEPTEVQRAAFEMILGGNDAVLLSETGTGKTLAYALPLVHRLIDRVQQQADEAAPIEDDTRPSLRRTPSRRRRPRLGRGGGSCLKWAGMTRRRPLSRKHWSRTTIPRRR